MRLRISMLLVEGANDSGYVKHPPYTCLSDRFLIVRSIVRFVDCSISLELENHRPPIANDYLEADIVQASRLNPTCLRHRDYEAIGYAKNLFVREASPIS